MKMINSAYWLVVVSLLISYSESLTVSSTTHHEDYTVLHEFAALNYTWDANHRHNDYVDSGRYNVKNCVLAGIAVDATGRIFLTVPRWKTGIPATLNLLQTETGILAPYPSWDIQQEGLSPMESLQNVQSMTIDQHGRMWTIDVGRRNFFASDDTEVVNGPAAVWLIDTKTDNIIDKYNFPEEVVSSTDSFVNDIVVDEQREIAYLSDAWGHGGIIVLDWKQRRSKRFSGRSTRNDPNYIMIINGINYGKDIFRTPIDGIAITDDFDAVFYCSVQGRKLWRIKTEVLRDFSSDVEEFDRSATLIGKKEPSDGLKYFNGRLYWGALTTSNYFSVEIDSVSLADLDDNAQGVPPDEVNLHWLDSFAIDLQHKNALYVVSNRLDRYFANDIDLTDNRMKIVRIYNQYQKHNEL